MGGWEYDTHKRSEVDWKGHSYACVISIEDLKNNWSAIGPAITAITKGAYQLLDTIGSIRELTKLKKLIKSSVYHIPVRTVAPVVGFALTKIKVEGVIGFVLIPRSLHSLTFLSTVKIAFAKALHLAMPTAMRDYANFLSVAKKVMRIPGVMTSFFISELLLGSLKYTTGQQFSIPAEIVDKSILMTNALISHHIGILTAYGIKILVTGTMVTPYAPVLIGLGYLVVSTSSDLALEATTDYLDSRYSFKRGLAKILIARHKNSIANFPFHRHFQYYNNTLKGNFDLMRQFLK